MADQRPTVELPTLVPPVERTTYSVKRAGTDDERSQSPLLERPGVLPLRTERKPSPNLGPTLGVDARWRVEVAGDRVTLRSVEGTQIELDLDEARRIAEQILRGR